MSKATQESAFPAVDTDSSMDLAGDGYVGKKWRFTVVLLGLIYVLAAAYNATVMYDDGYLFKHYQLILATHGFWDTFKVLFFIVDLGGREYRLYGVSKILHFCLWEVVGARAWFYGGFIACAQFLSGVGIYRILRRMNTDLTQACAVAATWILSPFAETTVFHHYSYLLLPCQLTIACALMMQSLNQKTDFHWKSAAALAGMGFLLVTTGDSHVPVTFVVLLLAVFFTRGERPMRKRCVDLLIVFAAMVIFIGIHRWGWNVLTDQHAFVHQQRFAMRVPDWPTARQYNIWIWQSIPLGVGAQLGPMFLLAGPWVALPAAFVIAVAVWIGRKRWPSPTGGGGSLIAALAVIFVASYSTIWIVSFLTAQVNPVLPRRYGYVPNTLFLMVVVALLAAPFVRRRLGHFPTLAGVGGVAWLWLVLVAVCIPMIRAQDARVWKETAQALNNRRDACVLFMNNWSNFGQPGFVLGMGSPGLRGRWFPEVFESPLTAYFWESPYAANVLHAKFVAYRYDDAGPSSVRLTGNGLETDLSVVVPKQSVVVVSDLGMQAPEFPKTRHRVTVFKTWDEFQMSSIAHNGVVVDTGWNSVLPFPAADDARIGFGEPATGVPGMLPDKLFQDPPPPPQALVVNYGMEQGAGVMFGPALKSPLAYFLSNRYGSYTYRIDFTDQSPKSVSLDLLEMWHEKPGGRPMSIDAAFDDQWFHAFKVFDPAAWAYNVPITVKLFPGPAHTFRVRLAPAPGATDVPFLNGIRVSRAK